MNNSTDLCALACYFNPEGYRSRRDNFEIFRNSLIASAVPHYIIELIVNTGQSEISGTNVFRVRCNSLMWQKERLLNILLRRVPERYTKIAWLDADILFEDGGWIERTSQELERSVVVQPFDTPVRLPAAHYTYRGVGPRHFSFCEAFLKNPDLYKTGSYRDHGFTGYAWASRREILTKVGLYDACLSGSGDHVMAHAFCGDWTSECIVRIFGQNTKYLWHFQQWAQRVDREVSSRIGSVRGKVFHLWHGSYGNRKYSQRDSELRDIEFDPARHLKANKDGCWEFADGFDPAFFSNYFSCRKEDS